MKRLLFGLFFLCVALSLTPGCNKDVKTSDEDLTVIQQTQLTDMLADQKKPAIMVDVRLPAKYDHGHLPGAINIPVAQIVASDPRLGRARKIIVYGGGWSDYLSSAAAKKMIALGYRDVFDYRGGVELWQQSGGRLEGAAATEPATQP